MISGRHIDTYMAGQQRITDALASIGDDDIAHRGDEWRDRLEQNG